MGLGSNLGHPEANLARAGQELARLPGVRIEAASAVYLTEPQGLKDQPWFANQVLALACAPDVSAPGLMARLLELERAMGRVRGAGQDQARRFGPRLIDLDLLLFGGLRLALPELTLPHPGMHERAFVLVPLLEVWPEAVIPGRGRAADILAGLAHSRQGRRIFQD